MKASVLTLTDKAKRLLAKYENIEIDSIARTVARNESIPDYRIYSYLFSVMSSKAVELSGIYKKAQVLYIICLFKAAKFRGSDIRRLVKGAEEKGYVKAISKTMILLNPNVAKRLEHCTKYAWLVNCIRGCQGSLQFTTFAEMVKKDPKQIDCNLRQYVGEAIRENVVQPKSNFWFLLDEYFSSVSCLTKWVVQSPKPVNVSKWLNKSPESYRPNKPGNQGPERVVRKKRKFLDPKERFEPLIARLRDLGRRVISIAKFQEIVCLLLILINSL